MEKYLSSLGYRMKDVVTGKEGVCECLSIDLYGCVQYLLRPPLKKDGTAPDPSWFDVTRCEQVGKTRVMKPISWRINGEPAGPADKPLK